MRIWTVADAKARLSEILHAARRGEPQAIGADNPCVVVSKEEFDRLVLSSTANKPGLFLVVAGKQAGFDIELPSRTDDRDSPVFKEVV
jgi:prevent-host-death family protein